MMLPDRRYRDDPAFRTLVDLLHHQIREGNYTPTEIREAAMLAQIQYEGERPRRWVFDGSAFTELRTPPMLTRLIADPDLDTLQSIIERYAETSATEQARDIITRLRRHL